MNLDEFWDYVQETEAGCWEWMRARKSNGYGLVYRNGDRRHPLQAHRVAWELATGQPVPAGLQVLHTCDNPACVRNDEPGVYEVQGRILLRFGHLALGTAEDNSADMFAKGRGNRHLLTHCKRGHAFTEANTRVRGGVRVCRHCKRLQSSAQYASHAEDSDWRATRREWQRQWRAANPDKIREQQRRAREKRLGAATVIAHREGRERAAQKEPVR